MEIRCLVVDDEQPAVDELAFLLSGLPDVVVVGSANSAKEAVEKIGSLKPDLVFLDINMPGHTGFHVIEACSDLHKAPLFIFCTAYDQYAVKAFEEQAVDYILKPFSLKRVAKGVGRARERLEAESGASNDEVTRLLEALGPRQPHVVRLSVESQGRLLLLDPDEVLFCRAEEKRVRVFTHGGDYISHGASTLDRLEELVAGYPFYRVHRASLVHLKHIREVTSWYNGKYLLVMDDSAASEVVVSRNRVKGLKENLGL
ncbi:LytR/AlgR family response regulator transcription factor [Desulfoluna spongiiphila]|uniref:Two component transcriptional regulator, LytTR family n=1 Tax=Desulfoluna spongiiphila TaxID=419481 RepID=A0A1G5JDC0_9BACT|nr:LytTR family DNA-binding domain-containing protein [Desulfoluna spongiiphila]SCY85789.1 two component transcriptional regulator, LytTR family [Desulfoluna spongiiphila]VVS90800.1 signal transduction response regulator receiver domain [Desulfoluna spongiiphila]